MDLKIKGKYHKSSKPPTPPPPLHPRLIFFKRASMCKKGLFESGADLILRS